MGYGYRSMSPDELKGYTMEVNFNDLGCELMLFSGDAWHYTKFKITYEELKEWRNSGRYLAHADWLRSEFVRQVLKKPEVADNMPHSGPREWMKPEDQGRYKPSPFCIFLSKWQVS